MRLFIASFARLTNFKDLKQNYSGSDLVWTQEENLHLTYEFLASQKDPQTVLNKLQSLPLIDQEFTIEGIGLLGHKILYAKVDSEILKQNYYMIHQALQGSVTHFQPHITLARIKTYDEASLQKTLTYPIKGSLLSGIHLVQSTLTPQGPIYTALN